VVSIAYWFDKKRALAIGLGACGTGIGTFVYAPMTQYFIEEYGWRGTVLLLAGTFFNMCVCGAVMRDPDWWIQEQNKSASLGTGNKSIKGTSSCGSISGRSGIDGDFPGVEEIRMMLKSGQAPEYLLTTLADNTTVPSQGSTSAEDEHVTSSRSVVNLPTFIRQKEKELHLDVWCVRGATATLRQPLWSHYRSKNTSRVLEPPSQRLCQVQEAGASITTTTTTTIIEPRERRR